MPSCAGSKQPARPHQKNDDEDQKDTDLAERFTKIEASEAFNDAYYQSADERAWDRAHAAQHDDGEGDEHERIAGARIGVIGRDEQTGGDGETRCAKPEGDRINVRDI